jgi:hypothetical protein
LGQSSIERKEIKKRNKLRDGIDIVITFAVVTSLIESVEHS